MDPARLVKISRYLSKHLRHEPERLGLTLEPGGWVSVSDLLAACASHRFPVSREELARVVADNDKRRFSFDETGARIRANQGHSVEVDLQLPESEPPALLYHGTAAAFTASIRELGLERRSRHHVHLSTDPVTARAVGARHGRPVIFTVDAAAMRREGIPFQCSDNGVWLVEAVPPRFLTLQEPSPP